MNTSKGFTLIELLVVIAIIGLLSSVTMASASTARKKAKVTQSIAQVRELEKAFYQIYDTYGCWPLELGADPSINSCSIIINTDNPSLQYLYDNNLIGIREYFKSIPVFPFGNSQYYYDNDGGAGERADCQNGTPFDSVGVYVKYDASSDIAHILEKAIDNTPDSELDTLKAKNCGRIQYDDVELDIQFTGQNPNM